MENDGGPAAIPMDSIKIKEILKERKERLLYVYDILNDNLFFIELMDIYAPDCAKSYPVCSASIGEPPLQQEVITSSNFLKSDEENTDDLFNDFDFEDLELDSEIYDGDEE